MTSSAKGLWKVKCRKIKGYKSFTTTRKLGNKIVKVHRLVCEVFNGKCPDNCFLARHINGTFAYAVCGIGSDHFNAKLKETDVKKIRLELENGEKGCVLSVRYNVTPATISLIKNRKNWSHI